MTFNLKITSQAMRLTALAAVLCAQGVLAAPVPLTNAGFEQQWEAVGGTGSDGQVTFNYGPTGPGLGWSFGYTGNGVAGSYSSLTAYEGNRFGFLQTGRLEDSFGPMGATISQSFVLTNAADIVISFALALRQGYAPGQHVRVGVDGQLFADFAVTSTAWVIQTVNIAALTAGTHSISNSLMK